MKRAAVVARANVSAIMFPATEPLENALTHRHGYIGCYLQPGVDPTAKPIELPPGLLPGVAPGIAMVPSTWPWTRITVVPPMPSVIGFVAVAYFALGVAVGALARRLRRLRTPILLMLVVPGVLAGLGYLAWVVYTLA